MFILRPKINNLLMKNAFLFLALAVLNHSEQLCAQRNLEIVFGEELHSKTSHYYNSPSETSQRVVRYFLLLDSTHVNSEFGVLRRPVGLMGGKVKEHLSLDAEVQFYYKKFRRQVKFQYVGIPAGIAALGVGLSYEMGGDSDLTSEQNNTKAYLWYGLGVGLAGVSYYVSYKSWDFLQMAIDVHNMNLGRGGQTLSNFKLAPTVLPSYFGATTSFGISLSYHFK